MSNYSKLKKKLAQGWNTWNTRSVLSHVLLPEGFAINLAIREYSDGRYLKEALIGRHGKEDEQILPGAHAYDGSYTELTIKWMGIELIIQSAKMDDEIVFLVTPKTKHRKMPLLVVETCIFWNRKGYVEKKRDRIIAVMPKRTINVFTTGKEVYDPNVIVQCPYFSVPLDSPIGISIGKKRTVSEIKKIIESNKSVQIKAKDKYGTLADVYDAIQTAMAWDTIYDPLKDRVFSSVTRIWNCNWGGPIIFCWDNYFAGLLASIDNKELAYANVYAITSEAEELGFVPNYSSSTGTKSRDRSQPPVGSTVAIALYKRFGDKWFLEELFDLLLTWNRWWVKHRDTDGFLCWGSEPYEPVVDNYWELHSVNNRFGGALESGLDNSPMYDDIPFDDKIHQLKLADVGLMSSYVMDCNSLAEIADILGKKKEAKEIRRRGEKYQNNLAKLWDEKTGIFLNRRTDTGEPQMRLSPTNFYPLLCGAATKEQAQRMMTEHFNNPEEFYGEWMIPSISRNDSAYHEQDYWRGRIWPSMNFLIYLGLRKYGFKKEQKEFSEKSKNLLLKEWREKRHIHENYNADTGEGCDKRMSDRFYFWGGLLGLIALIEDGIYEM